MRRDLYKIYLGGRAFALSYYANAPCRRETLAREFQTEVGFLYHHEIMMATLGFCDASGRSGREAVAALGLRGYEADVADGSALGATREVNTLVEYAPDMTKPQLAAFAAGFAAGFPTTTSKLHEMVLDEIDARSN